MKPEFCDAHVPGSPGLSQPTMKLKVLLGAGIRCRGRDSHLPAEAQSSTPPFTMIKCFLTYHISLTFEISYNWTSTPV